MSDPSNASPNAPAAQASPRSKQNASANTAAPSLSKNDNASALKVAPAAPVMALPQAPLVEPFKPFSAPSSLNKDSFFGQPLPKGSMSIRNTLKGRNIFVTGITGFLGKVFLERLIRTYFTEIGHIYVLIRPSRKQTVQQRLQQLLSNPLFNSVRKMFADRKVDFNQWIEENVVLLRGDLTLPLCGLSPENLALLRDNLHCVMHVAASVEFNKPLREALQSNVYGALQVLEIAQMCPVPPAFVYVSTAYVNSCKKPGTTCYESVYKVDFPVDALMEDYNNGKYLHDWLPYISGWPNTYTATKAVAETLLNMRRGRVPVVICRPSIVTPTALEPITGWTDSLAGMAPCYLGVAMGLRFWYAKRTSLLDHIPVDCVISAMLGALAVSDSPYYRTWLQLTPGTPLPLATARNSPTELLQAPSASHSSNIQVPVSPLPGNKLNNLVVVHSTSYRQPRSVGEWARTMREFAQQNPVFSKSFPDQIYVSSRVWNLTHQVQSSIPAKVLSTVANKTANPKLQNMSKQLDKFAAMAQRINASFGFFMSNDWHFVDNNLVQLFRQYVPDKEVNEMTWDVAEVDWNSYIRASVVGYHAVIDKFRSKL